MNIVARLFFAERVGCISPQPLSFLTPFFRYFNKITQTHAYTTYKANSKREMRCIMGMMARLIFAELVGCISPQPLSFLTPFFRHFNKITQTHAFTTYKANSKREMRCIMAPGILQSTHSLQT
jgi:hypothetical protein